MKKRKKVSIFFLRIFDINSVSWVSDSLAVPKLMLSDVCRNTKAEEQLNRSMDLS